MVWENHPEFNGRVVSKSVSRLGSQTHINFTFDNYKELEVVISIEKMPAGSSLITTESAPGGTRNVSLKYIAGFPYGNYSVVSDQNVYLIKGEAEGVWNLTFCDLEFQDNTLKSKGRTKADLTFSVAGLD